jgi:S1-C subfamily serine protease
MNYKNIIKTSLPLFVGAMIAVSAQAVGQNLKLNPIKPGSNKAITDEQQAILAVRKIKASVVNIIGDIKPTQGEAIKLQAGEVSGTGFIWSKDGYIVTNQHVVENEQGQFSAVFSDGTSFPAKVIGRDKYSDVALLKIEANNLTPAVLGDSNGLETGQSVFAIGNSVGKYQNTVTRGVVSGLSRAISVNAQGTSAPRLQNLIQTDASINPGNSGGPLINMAGEVVGMNTAIDTTAQGIGFAVPVNVVKASVEQIRTLGKVSHPYLGVSFLSLTKSIQEWNGLPLNEGAFISEVVAKGPAFFAGIKPGDIITAVDRQKITQYNELDSMLLKYQAGNQILVSLLRDGQNLDLPVILGEYK